MFVITENIMKRPVLFSRPEGHRNKQNRENVNLLASYTM